MAAPSFPPPPHSPPKRSSAPPAGLLRRLAKNRVIVADKAVHTADYLCDVCGRSRYYRTEADMKDHALSGVHKTRVSGGPHLTCEVMARQRRESGRDGLPVGIKRVDAQTTPRFHCDLCLFLIRNESDALEHCSGNMHMRALWVSGVIVALFASLTSLMIHRRRSSNHLRRWNHCNLRAPSIYPWWTPPWTDSLRQRLSVVAAFPICRPLSAS
jgi:hypothetical protein